MSWLVGDVCCAGGVLLLCRGCVLLAVTVSWWLWVGNRVSDCVLVFEFECLWLCKRGSYSFVFTSAEISFRKTLGEIKSNTVNQIS